MPTPVLLAEGTANSTGFTIEDVDSGAGVVLELDVYCASGHPDDVPAVSSYAGRTWTRLDNPSSFPYQSFQRWSLVIPRGVTPPTPEDIVFSGIVSAGDIIYQLKAYTGFLGATIDQAWRNFDEPFAGTLYAQKTEVSFDAAGFPGDMLRTADLGSYAAAGLFSDNPTEVPTGYVAFERTQTGNTVLVSGFADYTRTTVSAGWTGATPFIRRALYSELRAELFVEDLFEYPAEDPIVDLDGGTGWPNSPDSPWETQDDWAGYTVQSGSLSYPGLAGSGTGNRLAGGGQYRTGGRRLFHRAERLPVLYVSAVLARTGPEAVLFGVSPSAFSMFVYDEVIRCGVMYGDTTVRLWQLTPAESDDSGITMPTDGTPVFCVLKLEWTSGDNVTASLFVNPTPGDPEPGTPDAQITTTMAGARAIPFYLSENSSPLSAIDSVRAGEEWSQVTPTDSAPPDPSGDIVGFSPAQTGSLGGYSIVVGATAGTSPAQTSALAGSNSVGPDIGTPISTAKIMWSGHSLMAAPTAEYTDDLAADAGHTHDYEEQNLAGSLIAARTKGEGAHPGEPPWNGYSLGQNRVGSGLALIPHFRAPGTPYNALLLADRHGIYQGVEWEGTVRYARHYYELIREGSPSCVGYLYGTWLSLVGRPTRTGPGPDILVVHNTQTSALHVEIQTATTLRWSLDGGTTWEAEGVEIGAGTTTLAGWGAIRTAGTFVAGTTYDFDWATEDYSTWVQHAIEEQTAVACVASRINLSLAHEGRSDRLQAVPTALGLARLVEAAMTGAGVDGVTVFDGPDIDLLATRAVLFEDAVHVTPEIRWFLANVCYSTVYRRDCRGLERPVGMTETMAESLQEIAWAAVLEYFEDRPLGEQYDQAGLKAAFSAYLPLATAINGQGHITEGLQGYFEGEDSDLHFDAATDGDVWYDPPPVSGGSIVVTNPPQESALLGSSTVTGEIVGDGASQTGQLAGVPIITAGLAGESAAQEGTLAAASSVVGSLVAAAAAQEGALAGASTVFGALLGASAAQVGALLGLSRVEGGISGLSPAQTGYLTDQSFAGAIEVVSPAQTGHLVGVVVVVGTLASESPAQTAGLSGGPGLAAALATSSPAQRGALAGTPTVVGGVAGVSPAQVSSASGLSRAFGGIASAAPGQRGRLEGVSIVGGEIDGVSPAQRGVLFASNTLIAAVGIQPRAVALVSFIEKMPPVRGVSVSVD